MVGRIWYRETNWNWSSENPSGIPGTTKKEWTNGGVPQPLQIGMCLSITFITQISPRRIHPDMKYLIISSWKEKSENHPVIPFIWIDVNQRILWESSAREREKWRPIKISSDKHSLEFWKSSFQYAIFLWAFLEYGVQSNRNRSWTENSICKFNLWILLEWFEKSPTSPLSVSQATSRQRVRRCPKNRENMRSRFPLVHLKCSVKEHHQSKDKRKDFNMLG